MLRRAFTLYWVQILISLLIIAIFVGAAALWDENDLLEDADAVVSNPLQTTAGILALLLDQLENANILPLYIALLLMTPLLLALGAPRRSADAAASACIDLAARAVPPLNSSTCPLKGLFFNPIAWQLIFAIGIFAGRRLKRGGIAYDARLFAACLAVVAIAAGEPAELLPLAMRWGCGRTCATCSTAARPISHSRGSRIPRLPTSSIIPGSPD